MSNFYKHIILFCIIYFTVASGEGQLLAQNEAQPYMKWITEDDGLPSNEVYHVLQDDLGYIWFATDDGIVKYDGKSLEVFNKSNGLPENVVFRLYNESSGNIIGECLNSKYFTYNNHKINPFEINDSITKHLGTANISFSYVLDENGNQHFGTRYGYFQIDKKGNCIIRPPIPNTFESAQLYGRYCTLRKVGEQWVSYYSYNTGNSLKESNFNKVKIINRDSVTINTPIIIKRGFSNSFHFTNLTNGVIGLTIENSIILVRNDQLLDYKEFEVPALDLFLADQFLFVCTLGKGVYQYRINNDQLILVNHFLDGFSVTSGLQSSDGTIWLTTREKGVVKITNIHLSVINQIENDNISALFIDEIVQLIGTEKGSVISYNTLSNKSHRPITGFMDLQNGKFVAFDGGIATVGSNSQHEVLKWKKVFESYGFFPLKGILFNDQFLGIGKSTFLLYDWQAEKLISSGRWGKNEKERIYSVIEKNGVAYIASALGIDELDLTTGELQTVYSGDEIIEIQKFRSGLLGFSQTGNVVYITEGQLKKSNLPKFDKINRYYAFRIKGDTLVASNNLGVYKWLISPALDFSLIDYLALPRVNFIVYQKGSWYFATKKMLLEEASFRIKQSPKKVFLQNLLVNDEIIPFKKQKEFTYTLNNFHFDFRIIDYSSDFVYYKYKLDNHDLSYQYGTVPQVNYSSLPPGQYTFKVSATTDGFRYSDEATYSFVIYPPFWKTSWFIFLCVSATILIIITIVYSRIIKYRDKLRIENVITELRSQALTSQLNPHLIFNILNSIQGMVSEGEIENVNSYISKFSKFMRRTLTMSKQTFVDLSEEIKNTIQYTELEKLRFENSVQFEFNIEVKDMTIQIPPLIIQPLIENAIKHGIMPKLMDRGLIQIRILEYDDILTIEVEDNGIGFFSPNFLFGDGLRITHERLKVASLKNELLLVSSQNPTVIKIVYYK